MMDMEKEQTILDAAIAAVYRTTGIRLKVHPEIKKGNRILDTEITVEGYKKPRFTVDVKKWAQQANFGAMINQVQQLPGKGMLAADYVNPNMADRLRDLEIPYIDTVGNVYINEKPLYVLVKTAKARTLETHNAKVQFKTRGQGRAFNPTGLKVVYEILINEKVLNAPYREIASKADVALGTVGWVINDLKQANYLIGILPKKRRLKNRKQLLDKWVQAYLEKLRPKLFVGTYRVDDEYWWKKLNYQITKYDAQWGGEVAAAKLTGYLKPEEAIVYLPKNGGDELFREQRFRKDPTGNIHVFRAFWNREANNPHDILDTVDPMIVYADLLGTGDVRNIEAGRIIYQNELDKFTRED